MKINSIYILLSFFLLLAGCGSQASSGDVETGVRLNQVGYFASEDKFVVVVDAEEKPFALSDATGKEVLSGDIPAAGYWEYSGDSASVLDFSQITKEGSYTLSIDGKKASKAFIVSSDPYGGLDKSAVKALYYNRAGMEIDSALGGRFARPAGHPDTSVVVHASAATELRPEGTIISSPGGWYDAGDYNKYIVNSGISTFTLLQALSDFSDYYAHLDCDIPESGNNLPDLLDELLYNLRWMLTMQDPNDGGVYHKLTTRGFEGAVMPHEATSQRYVVQKSTAATLDFAAVCAKAVRVLEPRADHLPGLADSCRRQAVDAWEWAVKNPDVLYEQPEDISTGAYGDNNLEDEWYWAACELFLTEKESEFMEAVVDYYQQATVPSWGNVGMLGTISLISYPGELPESLNQLNVEADFFRLVDELVRKWGESPFKVSIDHFEWGSNSTVANEGMLKLIALKKTGNQKYLSAALSDLDYILGRNATDYCFVTGFGQKKVMNIHHRQSEADGIENPVPGFLAGGPNLATFEDCPDAERSQYPAKSYIDKWCSYSTNEITINWNAPLVYLSGGVNSIKNK